MSSGARSSKRAGVPEVEGEQTLIFRCPRGLEGLLPLPTPAAASPPDWLRTMPAQAFSALVGADDDTVKRCPPFVDAITCGFLIPLICDVKVENGEFIWDVAWPPAGASDFPRSPIGFHDASQVEGTPLFDPDRYLIKFHNLWTIEAPAGYGLLFTHPVNRFDLPFTTLTGLVDSDRYHDAFIHFPAHWRDRDFNGVIPRGTPIAQCIPVRRERWAARVEPMTEQEAQQAQTLAGEIARDKGVYRKRFRA